MPPKRRPASRRPAPPPPLPPLNQTEPIFDWAGIADRAVGRILATPKVQELGTKANGLMDLVRGFVQQGAVPPGAPPPQQPWKKTEDDPRVVMGFGPAEPLTVEKVKSRKKAMAQVLHSDKMGGSPEGMMRLNRAADTLLKELR